jgi:tripartite-type tricarboxylate transporter receptor subunit TctC
MLRKRMLPALTAFSLLIVAHHAHAQMSQPVKIVTPNPPGSSSDHVSRGVAEVLSKALNQNFIVENKPGASGTIAAQMCAQAVADGKTLCVLDAFNSALALSIFSNMPYDSKKDLIPIALLGFFPSGLWVNKNLPVNSMDELFELAKKQPGKLNFATFGAASSSSIYAAWLKNVRGIDMTNVSYKSALDAFRAVLAGEADVASYAMGPAMANSKPGDIKLLAVNNPVRLESHPQVPTLTESNMKAVLAWFGLFAPKGTPPELIERMNAVIAKDLINNPEMRKKFLDVVGIIPNVPAGESANAFAKFFESEIDVYAGLVKESGVEKLQR